MFIEFTDRASNVMSLASQEAQRFHHEFIGTEHILLGLFKAEPGKAVAILEHHNIDISKLCQEIEMLVKAEDGSDKVAAAKLPQTPMAKKVIECAMEECQVLNNSKMGTEHILLGLLRVTDGIAAQVLTNLGLSIDNARQEMLDSQ